MSETKTVKVSLETHRALMAMGRKGESFDGIICRLIEEWKLKGKSAEVLGELALKAIDLKEEG